MENRILLGFVLFSLTAIGFLLPVSAEEQTEDTVPVPFDFKSRTMGILPNGNFIVEYDRKSLDLEAVIANGTTGISNPIEASTIVEDEPEPIVEDAKPEKTILTRFEKDLERFENSDNEISADDRDYFELLKNLGECQRGYDESYGVMATTSFPISYTWINEGEAWLKADDYTGRHAELLKGIEECMAIRTVLNPITLGVYTLNIGKYFGTQQVYHADMAKISDRWLDIKTPQPLDEHDFIESLEDANKSICSNPNYHEKTKKQYGCESQTIEGDLVNPKGFVEYGSAVEDRWKNYLTDNGKAEANKAINDRLQQQINDAIEARDAQIRQYTGEGFGQ